MLGVGGGPGLPDTKENVVEKVALERRPSSVLRQQEQGGGLPGHVLVNMVQCSLTWDSWEKGLLWRISKF